MMNTSIEYEDPLSDWYLLSQDILNFSKKTKNISNKEELANIIDSISLVKFHDLQGNEITNAMGVLQEYESRDIIQSYSVQFVFEIIKKLVNRIKRLEKQKYMMPVLSEFLGCIMTIGNHMKSGEKDLPSIRRWWKAAFLCI